MGILSRLLFCLIASFFFFTSDSVVAESAQYCKFGSKDRPNADIDFCMGLTMHRNLSSNSHDLYLTITHTRHNGSALGWTAIGPGSVMAGTLMFIIYGDPLS